MRTTLSPAGTRRPRTEAGVWLAGDLHCATGDWTLAEQVAIAETRELDFLAVPPGEELPALPAGSRLLLVPLGVDQLPCAVHLEAAGDGGLQADAGLERELPVLGHSQAPRRSAAVRQGVGQPTTWVLADAATPEAVLAGLRRGATFVAAQPPAFSGVRLFLTVNDGEAHVCVENGSGSRLQLVRGDEAIAEAVVVAPLANHSFPAPTDGAVRAELYGRRQQLLAVTSPVLSPMVAG